MPPTLPRVKGNINKVIKDWLHKNTIHSIYLLPHGWNLNVWNINLKV